MKRSLQVIIAMSVLLILQGCSSYKCYIASCSEPYENSVITINESEEKAIFKSKRGLIWGGFQPGLMAADTTVIEIFYVEEDRGHVAFIKGLEPGKSVVYFANRLGGGMETPTPEDHAFWLEQFEESNAYFVVEVN